MFPRFPSNQASSRHIKATNEKSQSHQTKRQRRGLIPAQGNALGTIRRMDPSPEGAAHQGTIKAPSRQKTPVIVPHQGKSRHAIKLPMTPLNIQDPATGTSPINPPFAPSRLCAFALKPQQSRHIKAHQGCFRMTPFAPVHHPAPRLVAPLHSRLSPKPSPF